MTTERAALAALGGGCQVPIGIHCREGNAGGGGLLVDEVFAVVAVPETGAAVRVYHSCAACRQRSGLLGRLVAKMLLDGGAGPLLETAGRSAAMSSLPLAGRRVLVTRAVHQAGKLSEGLRALGAEPVEVPVLEIRPPESFESLDKVLRQLDDYHWLILTSANTVRALVERAAELGIRFTPPAR